MSNELLLEAAFTIYRRWVGLGSHRIAVRKAYEFMERASPGIFLLLGRIRHGG